MGVGCVCMCFGNTVLLDSLKTCTLSLFFTKEKKSYTCWCFQDFEPYDNHGFPCLVVVVAAAVVVVVLDIFRMFLLDTYE